MQEVHNPSSPLPVLTVIGNKNCLDKNYNIFQTMRFNHTMIFFKLIDQYKLGDIYRSDNNCLEHMLIT